MTFHSPSQNSTVISLVYKKIDHKVGNSSCNSIFSGKFLEFFHEHSRLGQFLPFFEEKQVRRRRIQIAGLLYFTATSESSSKLQLQLVEKLSGGNFNLTNHTAVLCCWLLPFTPAITSEEYYDFFDIIKFAIRGRKMVTYVQFFKDDCATTRQLMKKFVSKNISTF